MKTYAGTRAELAYILDLSETSVAKFVSNGIPPNQSGAVLLISRLVCGLT
jgi:hypothetical protein